MTVNTGELNEGQIQEYNLSFLRKGKNQLGKATDGGGGCRVRMYRQQASMDYDGPVI
jgi:hypothetical protein